ncbi:MAG: HD domain-containing protein, partial [Sedimentisphaerales bacterium]|nr:HD domain-containing protein [Sedimentisphaerales bacterium]
DAIENALAGIIDNKNIALECKCEILYATTLALTQELTSELPDATTLNKVDKLTQNTINLVLKDQEAFGHLFNISNHDFYTATHASNVSIMLLSYAGKIGIKDTKTLNDLGTGALLHDIGKIFVPQQLLNTSEQLSKSDFQIIQNHVAKGVEHLQQFSSLSDIVIKLIAEHHEKLNGKGYPNGLAGDEISIYGRIITIIDMFEAMTSVRPYRNSALPVEQAMDLIRDMAPEQLDENIVNSFTNFIDSTLYNMKSDSQAQDELILQAMGIETTTEDLPFGRRHQRYFFRARSTLRTVNKVGNKVELGPEHMIIVHDISQSGLGLLSNRQYLIDQIICVVMNIPQQKKEMKYLASVKRAIDHGDGWYTIGAELLKSQTQQQVIDIFEALK